MIYQNIQETIIITHIFSVHSVKLGRSSTMSNMIRVGLLCALLTILWLVVLEHSTAKKTRNGKGNSQGSLLKDVLGIKDKR